MYIPKLFNETDVTEMHAFIHQNPFAVLVTLAADGLVANHIPLVLDVAENRLRGHVARANPIWQDLAQTDVLVVFHGTQCYISPSWYASKAETGKVVPTWNYTAVHVKGRLTVIQDAGFVRQQIDDLTAQQEANMSEPWAVNDAPSDYIDPQVDKVLVGIEIAISDIQGKWKVSQNQPSSNQDSLVAALNNSNKDVHREMAQWIQTKRK